jgi:hypothetical protein
MQLPPSWAAGISAAQTTPDDLLILFYQILPDNAILCCGKYIFVCLPFETEL